MVEVAGFEPAVSCPPDKRDNQASLYLDEFDTRASERDRVSDSGAVPWSRTSGVLVPKVVGEAGFEPTAFCAQGRRSTRLSYSPSVETEVGVEPTITEVAAPRRTVWLPRHVYWWARRELHPRLLPYQGSALLLGHEPSWSGEPRWN